WERMPSWEESVFGARSRWAAISPAGIPGGPARTRRRNTARRPGWASADRDSMAFFDSIFQRMSQYKENVKCAQAGPDLQTALADFDGHELVEPGPGFAAAFDANQDRCVRVGETGFDLGERVGDRRDGLEVDLHDDVRPAQLVIGAPARTDGGN